MTSAFYIFFSSVIYKPKTGNYAFNYRFKTYRAIKQKKKTFKMIKEELLDSLKESEDEDEITLGKIVTSMKDSNKAIRVIKRY